MAGWLQKILTPPAKTGASARLPVKSNANLPTRGQGPQTPLPTTLPNATIIYGIGASLLFVASVSLLFAGRWFPALIVFALGACLTGFALHLLKHQD